MPRLLDLFCGAGGCSVGYSRAGFEVVGVDIEPQPNYPFEFVQGEALEYLESCDLSLFDAIHASPPCTAHSLATLHRGKAHAETHPELIAPTRELLLKSGKPWVVENVVGAPIRHDVMLCGEMFGLKLHRHRYFEIEGFFVMQPRHAPHELRGAEDNCDLREGHARQVVGNYADHIGASEAMGIDWMERGELNLAIPPAYTELIGGFLRTEVEQRLARV